MVIWMATHRPGTQLALIIAIIPEVEIKCFQDVRRKEALFARKIQEGGGTGAQS
jgi:hypothetical protein